MTSSRRLMKKLKGNKASSTPGKLKGESCKADWRKRYFFCNPRARKEKMYSHYHRMTLKLNDMKV